MALSNPLIQNIPIANPTTKEVLQEKLIIATDTPYSTTRTKQPYTELVTYYFDETNEGTFTQTVTADFALTELHLHIYAPGASVKTHALYINGIEVSKIVCYEFSTASQVFTFPGVLIRKGSELKLIATESGATSFVCFHSFNGYSL